MGDKSGKIPILYRIKKCLNMTKQRQKLYLFCFIIYALTIIWSIVTSTYRTIYKFAFILIYVPAAILNGSFNLIQSMNKNCLLSNISLVILMGVPLLISLPIPYIFHCLMCVIAYVPKSKPRLTTIMFILLLNLCIK